MVQLGPAELDLIGIRAGDANKIQVTITRAGRPVDLTDMTLSAMARSSANALDELDADITVVDAPAGKLVLAWPGDEVLAWLGEENSRTGVWDLELYNMATEDHETLVAGQFKAVMDVTHLNDVVSG